MNPLQTLHNVLRHAEAERDAARATLRRAEADAARARDQLDQLNAYRRQYEARWSSRFAEGSDISIVHCYQSFMGRLTQAIAQQERVVERCQPPLRSSLAELQSRELRVAAIRKLIERRTQAASLAGSQRERKQADESAALGARLRPDALF